MRTIRGAALGTYYAARAEAARDTPNVSPMRALVYAVKDNRDPPNAKQLVAHPSHPARHAVEVDRTNAIEYVTAILGKDTAKLARFFGVDDPRAITLVPVPSSTVTDATRDTARFPTLRLCRALAGAGLGTVAVLAVQRAPVVAKTQGAKRTASQVFNGLERTSSPIPRGGVLVLVDDNVHSGNSLAALDCLLGASRETRAFAVAVTDAEPCKDALKGREFRVAYEGDPSALAVTRVVEPCAECQCGCVVGARGGLRDLRSAHGGARCAVWRGPPSRIGPQAWLDVGQRLQCTGTSTKGESRG